MKSLFGRRKKGSAPPTSNGYSSGANGSSNGYHTSTNNQFSASLPASSKAQDGRLPPLPVDRTGSHGPRHATVPSPAMYLKDDVNEFGQTHASPAFLIDQSKNSSQSYFRPLQPSRDVRSSTSSPSGAKVHRRMSTGSIPAAELMSASAPAEELQLCYGYWPIETQCDLPLAQIEEIVRLCGYEIRTRGLEAPLLFSTQALDISCENICSLIRSYLANREAWRRDLRFANPHDLSGLIKWALGRYINAQGARGFLSWETYERWRFGEREKDFPPRYITTHMLYLLPTQTAALLTALFSVLSSAVAYTTKNGCTTRKLAALFSSYLFGLPDDGTFEQTYTAFNRFSHATEHLLLAFMRDQAMQHSAGGSPAPVPVRIREVIESYPQCLPTNLNKPPTSSKLVPVTRIRRHVRFYSKNLVATAGSWQVPRSTSWAMIAPFPSFDSENIEGDAAAPFAFTYQYRHLLNIRSGADEEGEGDLQKFGSVVEKEWSSFMHTGFAPPDESKLKFDLTESDRARRLQRRETMDWTTFQGNGFTNLLARDLAFDPLIDDPAKKGGILSPMHRDEMLEKARVIEKALPPFEYETTPREERNVQIDSHFLEVFSDVLCSSGWTRDEMKEANWALIQYKTRPRGVDGPLKGGTDGRTEDAWFWVEELVPSEYRAMLLQSSQQKPKSSRRISFMRTVRKKTSKLPPLPSPGQSLGPSQSAAGRSNASMTAPISSPGINSRSASPSLRVPDNSLFMKGKGGQTKQISLSKSLSNGSMAHSLITEEEETLDEPSRGAENGTSGQQPYEQDIPRGVSQRADGSLGFVKSPSTTSLTGGAANKIMSLARRATRRHRQSVSIDSTVHGVSPPRSPISITTPQSPGFDLVSNGVQGPGLPLASQASSPVPRFSPAPPSVADTGRSIETRVTNGHRDHTEDSVSPAPVPQERNVTPPAPPKADSLERELPPEPDAGDISGDTSLSRQSVMSEDPYDGLADDSGAQAGHLEASPAKPTSYADSEQVKTTTGASAPAVIPSAASARMYFKDDTAQSAPALQLPQTAMPPATPPKNSFPVRRDSIQANLSARIDAHKSMISQSATPVQGSGRVAAMAGKFNK